MKDDMIKAFASEIAEKLEDKRQDLGNDDKFARIVAQTVRDMIVHKLKKEEWFRP